ncbi:MAG: hypothetical protein J5I98_05175 [Phaeodactylibacter sp.]|nr:hypothetical protein [Phaeodactylibacter sp.]
MIDLQYISDQKELLDYYLFRGANHEDKQGLKDFSIAILKVSQAGFDSMVNEELEFQKLLEVSLEFLLPAHELFALFVERSPALKKKSRSYAGMFYRLKRELGEELFEELELDLPGNKSLFIGLMKVEMPALSIFLNQLTSSSFVFGILKEREKALQENMLARFYGEAVFIEKEKHVRINWLKGVKLLCGDDNLVFRLASDGQDNQYLEFYGPSALVDARIKNNLLPCLKEHFYLRRRPQAGTM